MLETNHYLDFYEYLKTQFQNLDEAIIFYNTWKRDWKQGFPEGLPFGDFTLQAMAAHISNVLEGKPPVPRPGLTNYMDTKYGPNIYFS